MYLTASTYHRSNAARPRPLGARSRLLAAAAGAFVIAALSAAPSRASTLVVEGSGEGHGVGMSQDGALGYAQHGASYRGILAHYYSGTTLGDAPVDAVVRVLVGSQVKRVPLERYVRGVVAAEMPSSWPLAALEAQAIASRTYALTAHAGGSRFDVYADTRSQVYRGVAAETSASNAAVDDTAGQIVLYGGRPATTYFFASSGGMTEDVQNAFPGSEPEPWLRGVEDAYEGTSHMWKLDLSFGVVAQRLRGLLKGAFRGIEVLERGVSPRILSARVLGSAGNVLVSGVELAARLGLASTWEHFSVRQGDAVTPEPDRSRPTPSAPAPTAAPASTADATGGVAPLAGELSGSAASITGGTSA